MAEPVKVGTLNVGATIALEEQNGVTGYYTLVKKDYNTGIALLWRNSSIGDTKWNDVAMDASLTTYKDCYLDLYLEASWYAFLPEKTKSQLSKVSYPIAASGSNLTQDYVSRYACTVSAAEIGGNSGNGLYGSALTTYTRNIGEYYWTRQIGGTNNNAARFVNSDGSFAIAVVTLSYYGVRPTVGVDQEKINATWDSTLQAYKLSFAFKAPDTLYLSGIAGNHITGGQLNTGYTLSWPAATGTVQAYNVQCIHSDGTVEWLGATTSLSTTAWVPPKGYETYTYKLYTFYKDASGTMMETVTPVTCKLSSKNSRIYVYAPYREGQTPQWYLADPKHYDNHTWNDNPNGMYYFGENKTVRLYGADAVVNKATYEVVAVDGGGAGFKQIADEWWESQNRDNSTFALCKVVIHAVAGTRLTVSCINSSEYKVGTDGIPFGCWDYGVVSTLNTTADYTTTNTIDVEKSFTDDPSRNTVVLDYGTLAAGDHYFYVKYIKDGSYSDGNDSIRFKITLQ